ncbi:CaiB/BaiF CoA-transferase family protein [Saccharopolyspora sp. NPDC050389]|uniref:CaiB/BaiF CoA transferase family protein n=1 Tax=Saccharopolyspora sp. NPDC050389 TaxID=3155516 RepID=UPI0033F4E3EE
MTEARGPLAGIRVLELGGIGPGPFCGMMLGDMGADVIRIDRPGSPAHPVLQRNRRSLAINLKDPQGAAAVRKLAATCDTVLEGFRPGVAERLGLGPDDLLAVNPALVYGRMTGWGQDGPLAQMPGHDINYIAIAGALHAIGGPEDPVPPLNLIGDFGGGGMLLAYGLACAMLRAKISGTGQVVDAAMVDGTASLLAMTYGFLGAGAWQDRRAVNRLDGGAPYYRVYRCADGKHMAVGCVEPQFFAAFLQILGLSDDPDFAAQNDEAAWPTMHRRLEEIFTAKPRDEWAELFAGTDACTTPVLSLHEAPEHPHNAVRSTYRTADGIVQPMPAPRFGTTPSAVPRPAPQPGQNTRKVLADAGLPDHEIENLINTGVATEV